MIINSNNSFDVLLDEADVDQTSNETMEIINSNDISASQAEQESKVTAFCKSKYPVGKKWKNSWYDMSVDEDEDCGPIGK
jgi:hypothetical protein